MKDKYLCSTSDFETRGNKSSSTVLQNMGFMELCHSKQHSFEGCSHIGGSERTCGPKQENGYSNKMVSPHVSCPSNISDLGGSINRPVCFSRELSDSDFLLMDSISRNFSTGCPVNLMGKNCSGMHTLQFFTHGFHIHKQIDPNSATLTQIADFLSELFENGLQYRTIAGYRSMLSAVL